MGRGVSAFFPFFLPALVACSSTEKPGGGDDLASASIGAAGGVLEGGGAKLEVPRGALSADTTIRIRRAEPPAIDGARDLTAVELLPDGLTFAAPARLTMAVDPSKLPAGGRTAGFVLFHLHAGATTPIGAARAGAREVSGAIGGFSRAAVGIVESPGCGMLAVSPAPAPGGDFACPDTCTVSSGVRYALECSTGGGISCACRDGAVTTAVQDFGTAFPSIPDFLLVFTYRYRCGFPCADDSADASVVEDARPTAGADARPAGADALPSGTDALPAGADALPSGADALPSGADALPADTGAATCTPTPVARPDVCTALGGAAARWLARCNPELTPADAAHRAALVCATLALDDPNATYDPAAAGRCTCDLESMSCSTIDPFQQLASCAAVTTGSIADGRSCRSHTSCASRYCQGVEASCGTGRCRPHAALGQPCQDSGAPVLCEAGAVCKETGCTALVADHTTCTSSGDCAGAARWIVPRSWCGTEAGMPACIPLGGANAPCSSPASCQPQLDTCVNGACAPRAGLGEACSVIPNLTTPTHSQWLSVMIGAKSACRFGNDPYCAQTGATTGAGTCIPLPDLGEPCGLGPGLAPFCAGGRGYCNGINPSALAYTSGTCVPKIPAGFACDTAWEAALGSQCQRGLACNGATRTCRRPLASPPCPN